MLLVSASGSVGFVGLVVPQLARRLVGAAHVRAVPVAAVLYPTVGGGVTYAYGIRSRNPDVLILLHSDGDPKAVEGAATGLPAAPAEMLDVGTGSGQVAVLLDGPGHRVTGIELRGR